MLSAATAQAASVVGEAVKLKAGGKDLIGYVARDKSQKFRGPGLLLVPEWWGVTDFEKARARELAEAGEAQLALHVLDLIAGGPAGEPLAVEARRLKAELCRSLAQTTTAFVSRSLYKTSANLLDQDASSWTALS